MKPPADLPQPRFAAIVPARNSAATLEETLDSLLAQVAPQWEAVVVDDGSTDGTGDIARRYAGRYPRIRVITTSGIGVSRARNLGLETTCAELVLFLDADDWVAPEFFDELGAALDAAPHASAAYCGSARIAPGGTAFGELPGEREVFRPELGRDAFALFAESCPVAIHSILVRRAPVEAAGGFDASLTSSEDWDLWLRLARDGARFVGVARLMSFYRLQPGAPLRDPVRAACDARRVIARAHETAVGRQARRLPRDRETSEACVTLYFAGIAAGHGAGARHVLESLHEWPDLSEPAWRELAVRELEAGLAVGARAAHGRLASCWARLRPGLEEIGSFVDDRSSLPGTGSRLLVHLEELVRSCADARPTP